MTSLKDLYLTSSGAISGWPLVREKSGKFDFSSRSGKSHGICKLVREISKIKKVREKSGNFMIWAKNIWVEAGILSIFKCLKMLIFFLLASLA